MPSLSLSLFYARRLPKAVISARIAKHAKMTKWIWTRFYSIVAGATTRAWRRGELGLAMREDVARGEEKGYRGGPPVYLRRGDG